MWQNQSHGMSKLDDIPIVDYRDPILKKLQAALVIQKPKNTLYFVKKWAQKQMKELQSQDQDQMLNEIQKQSLTKQSNKTTLFTKRRNAIVMAKTDENQQWIQFLNKQPLLKNQQCRSRIMISLREIPFLVNLGWEDINQLVQQAQIREYYQNEVFIVKGQFINRLYILIHGQISRKEGQNGSTIISEGKSLFVQSIISLFNAKYTYNVVSEKAWICGIQSYRIYELVQAVNRRKQEQYQKILMGVNLFSHLDRQQFYKLICMVKLIAVKKQNEIIVEQNNPVDKMFIVLKGEFLFCRQNLSGEITSFHTFREGQVFGQQWFIKPVQSESMVVAKTQGLLGFISRKDFQSSITPVQRLLLRRKMKRMNQQK